MSIAAKTTCLRCLSLFSVLILVVALHRGVIPVAAAAADDDDDDGTFTIQQLSQYTRVRAVYPVELDERGGLYTSRYTLCGRSAPPLPSSASEQKASTDGKAGPLQTSASSTTAAAAAQLSALCGPTVDGATPRRAFTVSQKVTWNTALPPGIHPLPSARPNLTTADLFYACAVYSCDMQDELPGIDYDAGSDEDGEGEEEVVYRLADAYGGLSPASPCCGSTNSTFILLPPAPSLPGHQSRLIIQTSTLPLTFLGNLSYTLLSEMVCGAEDAAASGACYESVDTGGTVRLVAPASACLLRMLSPRLTAAPSSALPDGDSDGGLLFPVSVALCGTDLSDVISSTSARLLRRGYTAVLATRELADSVAFPSELIRSIASWVASRRGDTSTSLLPAHKSASGGGGCTWKHDASAASLYRTGDYLSCTLDKSMVGHLPSLTLTISPGSVLAAVNATGSSNSKGFPCAFTLDLNALVTAVPASATTSSTYRLELHSTGSTTQALSSPSLVRFREPYIVIGATHLHGATVAVSRMAASTTSPNDPTGRFSGDAAVRNLPVMFLTALNAAYNESAGAGGAVCVAPQQCQLDHTYYPSLNLCGDTNCIGIFAYMFDPIAMRCTLRPVLLVLFAVLAFLVIVGDVVLVLVGRWAEQQRRAHVRLVEQVQRKNG